jgi:hypothetical protein
MKFVGRTSELGRLRHALDQQEASLVRVTGLRGGGKTALIRRAMADYDHLVHSASPFPDFAQRSELGRTVARTQAARGAPGVPETPIPDWHEIFGSLLELAASPSRPFVLVIDDAHRLTEARSRYRDALARVLGIARRERRPLHVVLVGPSAALPVDGALEQVLADSIDVGPLHFRAACPLLPGARPDDLLRAYAVFGGIPRVLSAVDRSAALGTNVRRVILTDDAVLADAGGTWLERDVQTPARYYSILATLAGGEADWSTVHAGLPDLTRSGQVAPYIRRLEELGLLVARRSLDAGPRTRARRYALTDPFFATWIRFVLAAAPSRASGTSDLYSTVVRSALDDHVARVFPTICRQHVAHDSIETLGAGVREIGSLWGAGYDLPVAGILTSGSAFYGACHWQPTEGVDTPLETLDRHLRETRYGFGRERRLRLVFTGHTPPRWLQREVARRHDATVIDPVALVGAD